MTAGQIVGRLRSRGAIFHVDGNHISIKAPSGTMTPRVVALLKSKKDEIIKAMNPRPKPPPGHCEQCPAGGTWEAKGRGLWCCHDAYFLGKPSKPIPSAEVRSRCPLMAVYAATPGGHENRPANIKR